MKPIALSTLAARREAGFAGSPLTIEQKEALRDCLRHCGPETYESALRYWETGDPEAFREVALGIVAAASDHNVRKLPKDELDRLSIVQDLAVDSLSLMEIGLLLEDALQISVNNNELLEMRTFGETIDYLNSRTSPFSEPSKSSKARLKPFVQNGDMRSLENARGGIIEATAKAP